MDVEQAAERVLVIPTAVFHECGYFEGFSNQVDRYKNLTGIDEFPPLCAFVPRGEIEDEPGWKQLVSYILVRRRHATSGNFFLSYRRGQTQADGRLRGNMSIGFGGHIQEEDEAEAFDKYPGMWETSQTIDFLSATSRGMLRELFEELKFGGNAVPRMNFVGLVNEDRTDLGRVHLGLVWVADVIAPTVTSRESTVREVTWQQFGALLEQRQRYEPWSQLVIAAAEWGLLTKEFDPQLLFGPILDSLA